MVPCFHENRIVASDEGAVRGDSGSRFLYLIYQGREVFQ